jgi:flavorubredoxin
VRILDAGRVHVSFLIREAWKRRGLILGAPTYDAGIFPPVEYLLRLLERKRLGGRIVGLFGSYGWRGGSVEVMRERVEALGWELVDAVAFPGAPTPRDFSRAQALGEAVAHRVAGTAAA